MTTTVDITSMEFARAARGITAAGTRLGLKPVSFRAPPRILTVNRSIRWAHGRAIVSVRLKGRSFDEVVSDMVDGVLTANGIHHAPEKKRELMAAAR